MSYWNITEALLQGQYGYAKVWDFPLMSLWARLLSCLSHGLPTNKMKNLFKQKVSIWYAPLSIPSSPQTHSKLCSQWTTPLYHLFRQETYKFHFQEKWFWEP